MTSTSTGHGARRRGVSARDVARAAASGETRRALKFGTFYEHQLPRPWKEGDELRLFTEALEQVEVADRLGFDYVWEVEHHFLEEYSHSSAPEIFLAAASQRTRRMRLGHGIRLMPPAYNPPQRVAEGIATLDLVSGGRVEWGTGQSASRAELEGFGIEAGDRHAMWEECTREVARMLSMSPYPGHEGRFFSMPPRNFVPKPVQRPHPPLWLACPNREIIKHAARRGMGALTFSFLSPDEAKLWVEEYYTTFERECDPIGLAVNPNVAMVAGFGCHRRKDVAVARFKEGFDFFKFALGYYYSFGRQIPAESSLWQRFVDAGKPNLAGEHSLEQFDTPKGLRRLYEAYEAAGVDQIVFIQQAGNNTHAHICQALELFAAEVMPGFAERDDARSRAKAERLAPAIERAMARRREADRGMRPSMPEGYRIDAYGLADPARRIAFKKAGLLE